MHWWARDGIYKLSPRRKKNQEDYQRRENERRVELIQCPLRTRALFNFVKFIVFLLPEASIRIGTRGGRGEGEMKVVCTKKKRRRGMFGGDRTSWKPSKSPRFLPATQEVGKGTEGELRARVGGLAQKEAQGAGG